LNKFLKKDLNFEISKELLDKNCFIVSAATHFGLENWTKHLVDLLKKTKMYDTTFEKTEKIEFKEWEVEMVTDITKQEKPKLLEK
jgi:hypothetical protein